MTRSLVSPEYPGITRHFPLVVFDSKRLESQRKKRRKRKYLAGMNNQIIVLSLFWVNATKAKGSGIDDYSFGFRQVH